MQPYYAQSMVDPRMMQQMQAMQAMNGMQPAMMGGAQMGMPYGQAYMPQQLVSSLSV